jgi:hypothetical protein
MTEKLLSFRVVRWLSISLSSISLRDVVLSWRWVATAADTIRSHHYRFKIDLRGRLARSPYLDGALSRYAPSLLRSNDGRWGPSRRRIPLECIVRALLVSAALAAHRGRKHGHVLVADNMLDDGVEWVRESR